MDTNKYVCKAAGFYSLTPEGNDFITFMENSKKETIAEILKELKKQNPDSIIFLLIDNWQCYICMGIYIINGIIMCINFYCC